MPEPSDQGPPKFAQPAPLDYAPGSPRRATRDLLTAGLFLSGLTIGIVISLICYVVAGNFFGVMGLLCAIPVALVAKLALRLHVRRKPDLRGFGGGLLTSILLLALPVGLMTLVIGACYNFH